MASFLSLMYISPFQMVITSSFVSFQQPRLPRQKDVVVRSNNKHPVPLGNEVTVNPQSLSESSHFVSGGSTVVVAAASQPPIGTPPINSEAQAIKYMFLSRNLSFGIL